MYPPKKMTGGPYPMCIKIYKIEKLSRDGGQNWYMLASWMPFNIPTTNENTTFGLHTSKI